MKRTLLLSAVLALGTASAQAATVSVTGFSKAAYDAAVGGFADARIEDFEDYAEANIDDGWTSAVGSFSSIGGTGSGGTVTASVASGNFAGNDGSKLAIRDGNVYGRTSTTADLSLNSSDDTFLDSNDTYGIRWVASLGGGMFDRLVFTLTDATDVGATMKILVGGSEVYSLGGLGNASKKLVDIALGGAVSSVTILFENRDGNGNLRANDGFSLDDIALSAVPLPPGALLLVGGLGALGALRRKKRAA